MVGAGPAGSSAARAAAAAGARVVVLDRAAFPRYKTCGGGLIGPVAGGPARGAAGRGRRSPGSRCRWPGGRRRTRTADRPCLQMVTRAELDAWLLVRAAAAGAEVRVPCRVRVGRRTTSSRPTPGRCGRAWSSPRTAPRAGWPATSASGCRGSTSAWSWSSRPARSAAEWADRVHLDWGPDPGLLRLGLPQGRHPHRRRDRRPRRRRRHPRATCATSCAGLGLDAAPRRARLRPPHPVPHAVARRSAAAGCCSPATPPGCSSRGPARASRSPSRSGALAGVAAAAGPTRRGRALPRRAVRRAAARDGRRRALPARLRGPPLGLPRADPLDPGRAGGSSAGSPAARPRWPAPYAARRCAPGWRCFAAELRDAGPGRAMPE